MSLKWARTNASVLFNHLGTRMSVRRCFFARRSDSVVVWVYSSHDKRGWWVCTHAPHSDFFGPYDRIRNAMFVAENIRSFLKEEA